MKKLRPGRTRTYSVVGTLAYIPPEILEREGHGVGCDFWALGVLIFELLSRTTPFHSKSKEETYNNIVQVRYTFPEHFPKDAADLVHRLLQRKDIYRLGVLLGVEAIKAHKWFEGFDWEGLRNQTLRSPIVPVLSNSCGSIKFSPYVHSRSTIQFPVYKRNQRVFDDF